MRTVTDVASLDAVPAVPLNVGLLLTFELLAGDVNVTAGADASMVRLNVLEDALVLPSPSVAFAVMVWEPFASALVPDTVKLQVPVDASAVVVPRRVAPSYTDTVLLFCAVPVNVGVVTLVMLSPRVPLSLAVASCGVDGAAGRIVNDCAALAEL